MRAIICDICRVPIEEPETEVYQVTIFRTGSEKKLEMCPACWSSPIILSEMRRTRTRKPKAKVGRPKGRKVTTSTVILDETVADLLTPTNAKGK